MWWSRLVYGLRDDVRDSTQLDRVRWFSQRRIAQRRIFGGAHPRGLWPPNLNSAEICVHCTYPKFHHPTRSQVIVLTNKHTHTHTNKQTLLKKINALHFATTLGNKPYKAYIYIQGGPIKTVSLNVGYIVLFLIFFKQNQNWLLYVKSNEFWVYELILLSVYTDTYYKIREPLA